MTIKTYNELKSKLDQYFDNLFTIATHSTDSNKINIGYQTSSLTINLPISELELGNALTLLLLNEIEKETTNEKNQRF